MFENIKGIILIIVFFLIIPVTTFVFWDEPDKAKASDLIKISVLHKPKQIAKTENSVADSNKLTSDNSFETSSGTGEFILNSEPATIDTLISDDFEVTLDEVSEEVVINLMQDSNRVVNGFKLPAGKTYILEEQEDGTVNLTWEKNN